MSEEQILNRLEKLEQQYKQLQKVVEQLQCQLGRQSVNVASDKDKDRPWIEG